MKKLILASVAAIAMSVGIASAQGIILGTDENDNKLWINTWAGQTEDKEYGRQDGSSASTFSGRRFQSRRGGESVSTTSSRSRYASDAMREFYGKIR